MTNFEAIKQGTHKGFNELLEKINTEALAEVLSDNELLEKIDTCTLAEVLLGTPCKRCVCKTYCDNSPQGLNCQDVIENWLNEDEEK